MKGYAQIKEILAYLSIPNIGVVKSDTARELDTTNSFINLSWVEAKRVRVIFGLI